MSVVLITCPTCQALRAADCKAHGDQLTYLCRTCTRVWKESVDDLLRSVHPVRYPDTTADEGTPST